MYDIIIIGGGPAGLTAALYAGRANRKVLLLEKATFGGQITFSPMVENIPGFPAASGNAFAEQLVDQVLAQGVDMEAGEVVSVQNGDVKTVVLEDGTTYEGLAVIVAVGARHRLLGVPGEEELIGAGVSFCAVCDGAFYQNGTVAVIGGGNSALQEALLLADLAKKVYVVQNLDVLTGEQKLCERLAAKENVEVLTGTVVERVLGTDAVTGITLRSVKDGATRDLSLDGVFVAIGLLPQNEPFANLLTLDARGYAEITDDSLRACSGVFVAGDCRQKQIRQVTTAAADGAIAALSACDYVKKLLEK